MSPRLHPDTEIGYVRLKVSNLERSVQFYREVIGFDVLEQQGQTVKLTADGKHPLLILEEIPNASVTPRRGATGLYHFAILVPDRGALSFSLRSLAQHGIGVGSSDHLVSEALYINDPDLNGIEIYRDRPRETWPLDENGEYRMAVDPLDLQALVNEAGDRPWHGLEPGTKIGHVHFHVSDLKKAKEFYVDLLGFDVTSRYGNEALFVSAGGYHHHLGLNTWAGVGAPPPPPNAVGIDYYTLILPDKGELDNVLDRLGDAGITLVQQEEGWLFQDPFGVGIKLVV